MRLTKLSIFVILLKYSFNYACLIPVVMLRRNKGFCRIVWSQYLCFDGMINNNLSVFVRSPVIYSIFFCAGLYRGYRFANRRTSSPPLPRLPRARIIKSSCISSDLRRSGISELKKASKEEEDIKERSDRDAVLIDTLLIDRSCCCVHRLFVLRSIFKRTSYLKTKLSFHWSIYDNNFAIMDCI